MSSTGLLKKSVRTFDLFDTLLARRCFNPHDIFFRIETTLGHRGFAKARIAAEATVFEQSYNLDDIYHVLEVQWHFTPSDAELLKQAELKAEWDSYFAIKETCEEVSPGDIVVSDMYLPRYFLERVIKEICKLDFCSLLVSSHGKRNGKVWPKILLNFQITSHLGDNELTDIQSAKAAGIPSFLTTLASLDEQESLLVSHGFDKLAMLSREARLSTWDADPSHRKGQLLQISYSFPFLFLTSLSIIKLARVHCWNRMLFSSRDCFLWMPLFQQLTTTLGMDVQSRYFLTSRLAKFSPSHAYKDYFRSQIDHSNNVILDLCGTGWSASHFLAQTADTSTTIFFINKLELPGLVEKYNKFGLGSSISKQLWLIQVNEDNNIFEMANCAPHPMLKDMVDIDGVSCPVFSSVSLDEETMTLMKVHHDAFKSAQALVGRLSREDCEEMLRTVEPKLLMELYHKMVRSESNISSIARFLSHQITEEHSFVEEMNQKSTFEA